MLYACLIFPGETVYNDTLEMFTWPCFEFMHTTICFRFLAPVPIFKGLKVLNMTHFFQLNITIVHYIWQDNHYWLSSNLNVSGADFQVGNLDFAHTFMSTTSVVHVYPVDQMDELSFVPVSSTQGERLHL